MSPTIKSIPVTHLQLSVVNPRFEPVETQREAIHLMIENQGDKLYRLASDIVEFGLNPSDLPIVVPDNGTEDMYVVEEGNRRVAALKLLLYPDLIPDEYQSLKKKFRTLSNNLQHSDFYTVPCVVFDDSNDATHWVELKHTGENEGIGTVQWDTKQQHRFRARLGKNSIALEVLQFVRDRGDLDDAIKERLSELPITNLERLLDDPDVRKFLGLELVDGKVVSRLPEKEVLKGLRKIIRDLVSKTISVKDIYYKQNRRDYLETFQPEDVPDFRSTQVEPWVLENEGTDDYSDNGDKQQDTTSTLQSPTKHTKSKRLSIERKCLIPSGDILRIDEDRINSLYKELKRLNVEEFPNACAVSLRVFLELSLDYFIEKNAVPNVSKSSKLVHKAQAVITYLKREKNVDKHQLKPAEAEISSPTSVFSIDTLNAYVHNKLFRPKPDDLKLTWDNMWGLFRAMFDETR